MVVLTKNQKNIKKCVDKVTNRVYSSIRKDRARCSEVVTMTRGEVLNMQRRLWNKCNKAIEEIERSSVAVGDDYTRGRVTGALLINNIMMDELNNMYDELREEELNED